MKQLLLLPLILASCMWPQSHMDTQRIIEMDAKKSAKIWAFVHDFPYRGFTITCKAINDGRKANCDIITDDGKKYPLLCDLRSSSELCALR